MKDRVRDRIRRRIRRKRNIRKKIFGTREKPRLSIFRSSKYIYSQIIDDAEGKTLVSVNDRDETIKKFLSPEKTGKTGRSFAAGKALARLSLDKGIETISFDRCGYLYHGRIKAFADGAREGGLKF